MIEPVLGLVPLGPLRSAVASIFVSYDEAVKAHDGPAAKRAKRAIIEEGKRALAPLGVERVGGIYFFLERVPSNLRQLKYIGRSRPSRPLARRIVDRFRDDTALDCRLYDLPVPQVREIAYLRMRTAMRSRDETLRVFAEKHCRTMEQFRYLSHIGVIPIIAPQFVIDDVEHLLIWTASAIGCGLQNVQERRRPRPEATQHVRPALSIVEQLRGVLDAGLFEQWSGALGALAS